MKKENNEQEAAKLKKVLNYFTGLYEYCKSEFDRRPTIEIDDNQVITLQCFVHSNEKADKLVEKLNTDAFVNYFPGEAKKFRANVFGFTVRLSFHLDQIK
jgi:hypothetical protein